MRGACNMRGHLRDQKKLWYRLHTGRAATYDGDGYENGVKETYSAPVAFRGNLDDGSSQIGRTVFGGMLDYTHVLIVFDPGFPIDEESVLNYYTEPTGTDDAYDFTVRARREGLNHIMYALNRATVS